MRLIDADALENKVLKWMPTDPCGIEEKEHPFETDIVVSLMMEIEEAPIIEPKQGEWIDKGADLDGTWYYQCSECSAEVENVEYPHCPYCLARMKGADE